jgi:hypothetical protein
MSNHTVKAATEAVKTSEQFDIRYLQVSHITSTFTRKEMVFSVLLIFVAHSSLLVNNCCKIHKL